jgi:hypothetical protein
MTTLQEGEVSFGEIVNSRQDPNTGKFIDEFLVKEFIRVRGVRMV